MRQIKVIIPLLLLCWYGIFLIQGIDLATADLGRHIKNGEILLQNFSFNHPILNTNFYSYTQPNFPVINHHWLSGIIFYLVFKISGFAGVHLFFIFLSFLTFWLFFRLAKKEAGLPLAAFLSLLLIPLIAERVEVRPEVFSYLFSGIFLNLLWRWRQGVLPWKWLLLLPVLQVVWANLHIYFFLGPVVLGVFLCECLIIAEKRRHFLKLLGIFLFSVLATTITPFGLQSSLAPLTIFQNYGYRLVENQSIWFLERLGFILNPNFLLFKVTALILFFSFLAAAKANWRKISFANLLLALGFLTAGALALRNFTIFGLFCLPLLAANLKILKEEKKIPEKIKIEFFSLPFNVSLAILALLITVLLGFSHYSRLNYSQLRLGVLDGNQKAAGFFKENNLKGPIFNNYDIGGYLIFELFPGEKVFVDNRPEAYSREFFENEYIPMQENGVKWQEAQEKYGFNAIFFSYKDATPWGQQFLLERVKDKNWAPVYVDNYAIIFLERNEQNSAMILKYEVPGDRFKTNI